MVNKHSHRIEIRSHDSIIIPLMIAENRARFSLFHYEFLLSKVYSWIKGTRRHKFIPMFKAIMKEHFENEEHSEAYGSLSKTYEYLGSLTIIFIAVSQDPFVGTF